MAGTLPARREILKRSLCFLQNRNVRRGNWQAYCTQPAILFLKSAIECSSEGEELTQFYPTEKSGAIFCPASLHILTAPQCTYFLLEWTRSPSAVVAIPGSLTTWRILFPESETMICRCRSGKPGTEMVWVPVQSAFTE